MPYEVVQVGQLVVAEAVLLRPAERREGAKRSVEAALYRALDPHLDGVVLAYVRVGDQRPVGEFQVRVEHLFLLGNADGFARCGIFYQRLRGAGVVASQRMDGP